MQPPDLLALAAAGHEVLPSSAPIESPDAAFLGNEVEQEPLTLQAIAKALSEKQGQRKRERPVLPPIEQYTPNLPFPQFEPQPINFQGAATGRAAERDAIERKMDHGATES